MKPALSVMIVQARGSAAGTLAPHLITQGVRVTTVTGHEVAVLDIATHHYDCVVVDVGAGRAVVEAIRAIRATSAVPLLVISSNRDASARVAALDAGADDCVSCPVSERELSSRIGAAVRRARAP